MPNKSYDGKPILCDVIVQILMFMTSGKVSLTHLLPDKRHVTSPVAVQCHVALQHVFYNTMSRTHVC